MGNKVELYVYDLSNGMAKAMSFQLTGKQIDGIWHTSVVVFGKEHFYGQGISVVPPGQSHHGKPLHVVGLGETELDEATWGEYLNEMSSHYTADKYHLLDFNCNSFTNDCVGFLTGGSIPDWIKDLPSDFLSTPFGAALRPTIDSMFLRPVTGAAPQPALLRPTPDAASAAVNASPNPALAASLLSAVANQAFSPTPSGPAPPAPAPPMQATNSLAGAVQMCTNPASMHSVLRGHRAVVAFFTSQTCGPCRMIEPVWERIAEEKTQGAGAGRTAFVKVDLGVGMGNAVGAEFSVRVTPTFIFFLDGSKVHEMKGADASDLRTQVDLLLFQAFPPHKHTSLSLPAVEALSTNPILFTQVPDVAPIIQKLSTLLTAASAPPEALKAKELLSTSIQPYIKNRIPSAKQPQVSGTNGAIKFPSASPQILERWAESTSAIAAALPAAELFPLIDLWRLAVLDEPVSAWLATNASPTNPLHVFLTQAVSTLDAAQPARNTLLLTLRLLANCFSSPALARSLLAPLGKRAEATRVLVASLLHADQGVRTAAASVAFDVAAWLQKGRVDGVRGTAAGATESEEDGEWEIELVSAVLEAISNEKQSEDIVHRLTAALSFLLRLSPVYDTQLVPFLEVLQARSTLRGKLEAGGCGDQGVQKKDVRKLIEEVAAKLCP